MFTRSQSSTLVKYGCEVGKEGEGVGEHGGRGREASVLKYGMNRVEGVETEVRIGRGGWVGAM